MSYAPREPICRPTWMSRMRLPTLCSSATTPVPSSLKGAALRRADRRFAVYRNNVAGQPGRCARRARFPWCSASSAMSSSAPWRMPSCCASRHLSPLLIQYGETFPAFIEEFDAGAAAALSRRRGAPRICARARLSRCRCRRRRPVPPSPRCRQGASAPPRHAAPFGRHYRFALSGPVDLGGQSGSSVRAVPHWGAEAAVVARPFLEVGRGFFSPAPMRSCSRFRRDRRLPRRWSVRPQPPPSSMLRMVSPCSSARISPSPSTSEFCSALMAGLTRPSTSGKRGWPGSSPAMTSLTLFSGRAQARKPAAHGSRSDDRGRWPLDRGR